MLSRALKINTRFLSFPPRARSFFSTSSKLQTPLFYTETHEWIKVNKDTNTARVGISSYAADKLGEVTYVTLEEIDFDDEDSLQLSKGEDMVEIESVKAAETIKMPVKGKITKINDDVMEQAVICGRDPEDSGWLTEIEIEDMAEIDGLMTKEQYQAFCEGEA